MENKGIFRYTQDRWVNTLIGMLTILLFVSFAVGPDNKVGYVVTGFQIVVILMLAGRCAIVYHIARSRKKGLREQNGKETPDEAREVASDRTAEVATQVASPGKYRNAVLILLTTGVAVATVLLFVFRDDLESRWVLATVAAVMAVILAAMVFFSKR